MKKKLISLIGAALLLLTALSVNAAVTQTRYRLIYNPTTCRYEVYMIVTAGSASTGAEMKAYTAQVSIVVPVAVTSAGVSVVASNYPQQSFDAGATLEGANTINWSKSNTQAGSATFGLNGYRAIAFTFSPSQAFYPPLNTNDTIMLFAFTVANSVCGQGVRLWENNYIQAGPGAPYTPATFDPTSALFNNKDFNNGHDFYNSTNAASAQTYTGNSSGTTTMPPPQITAFSVSRTGTTITGSVTASANTCATSTLTYAWTGPASFTNSTTSFSITGATTANNGTYAVTVTNSNGCTATAQQLISIPLPIHLLSFDGRANGCKAELQWQIGAGEKDFQRFEVQYSSDGARFVTVGELERNAFNEHYSFSYVQASGKGYYRLKILDLAGKSSYSDIAVVTTACDAPEITLAPNPTAALSTISGIQAGDQVKVTDVLGNVIANYISGGSKATIDLGMYPAGVYSVIISRDAAVIKTDKITKM